MKKKQKTFTEVFDDKGNRIENIQAIVCYKNGIVVGTPKGLYTNVKSLIKSKDSVK